jgi:hypothetical protein
MERYTHMPFYRRLYADLIAVLLLDAMRMFSKKSTRWKYDEITFRKKSRIANNVLFDNIYICKTRRNKGEKNLRYHLVDNCLPPSYATGWKEEQCQFTLEKQFHVQVIFLLVLHKGQSWQLPFFVFMFIFFLLVFMNLVCHIFVDDLAIVISGALENRFSKNIVELGRQAGIAMRILVK